MSSVKNLTSYLEELKLINSQLKTKIQLTNLEQEVVWKKIHIKEQEYFSRYIEIFGIPNHTNENCCTIVEKIGSRLCIEMEVMNAFRKPGNVSGESSKIIAELKMFAQKRNLMINIKRMGLYASQLNENWPATRIYINEFLTPHYSDLFYRSRMLGKKKNFKFIWYRNLEIRIQKDESSEILRIQQHSDLLKID